MAKGDLFSTVLRGFHKEQVSQYLNDLIRKYEREKEELNKSTRESARMWFRNCGRKMTGFAGNWNRKKTRNAELEQQKGRFLRIIRRTRI